MKKNKLFIKILFLAITSSTLLLAIVLIGSFQPIPDHFLKASSLDPVHVLFWGGTDNPDVVAKSVAVDADGNIYTTGYRRANESDDYDVFVRKYTTYPYSLAWEILWGGDEDDLGEDIALDPEGNPVVVGASYSLADSGYQAFVAKFSATNGALIMDTTREPIGFEVLWAVDVDDDGIIYTAGDVHITSVSAPDDYEAIYIIWEDDLASILHSGRWLNGSAVENDRAYDIKATGDGGWIIVGDTQSAGEGLSDAFLASYNMYGVLEENVTWGTTNFDFFEGLVLEEEAIYAAGATNTPVGYTAALVKYNYTLLGLPDAYLWNATYDRPSNDLYYDVCLGSDNYLYTTGYTYDDTNKSEVLISKFSEDGTLEESGTWGSSGLYDSGYGIVGRDEHIYLTGGTNFNPSSPTFPVYVEDAMVLIYGPNVTTTTIPTTTTPTSPSPTTNETSPSPTTNETSTSPTNTSAFSFPFPAYTIGITISGLFGFIGILIIWRKKRN